MKVLGIVKDGLFWPKAEATDLCVRCHRECQGHLYCDHCQEVLHGEREALDES